MCPIRQAGWGALFVPAGHFEMCMSFIFMVIILVIVMTLFEKLKTRLLRWTIS